MTTYRTMNRFANSDLSEYRNLLFGLPTKKNGPAQQFGTSFHALLLEHILPINITPTQLKHMQLMRESVLRNRFARTVLETALVEQVQTWIDPITGLPCKALTDIWETDTQLIVDVKTTSAQSYSEFLRHCEQYDYDRQTAYYLDGTPQAKRFVILGVQKKAPYEVFYFEGSACRGFVEGGRKKYRRLLGGIQRDGFTPSSWRPELTVVV